MHKGLIETNDEYLDRFKSWLQNLIPEGGEQIMCILKTMDKLGATDLP